MAWLKKENEKKWGEKSVLLGEFLYPIFSFKYPALKLVYCKPLWDNENETKWENKLTSNSICQ